MDITPANIERLIYLVRNQKVMLDSDLAQMYGVETKVLNQTIRRNPDRFPSDFVLQLTKDERESLRSQFVTFRGSIAKRKYLPYMFTEQGVAMLSSVLNSKQAIRVNVLIMRTFVKIMKLLSSDESLIDKMEKLEKGTLEFKKDVDKVFRIVFERLDILEVETPPLPHKRRRIGIKNES